MTNRRPARVQAERQMLEKGENKEYLPIQGLEAFRDATVQLLLGKGHEAITSVRPRTLSLLFVLCC